MSNRRAELCSFDRSLSRLAILHGDGRLKIWDTTTGALLFNWRSNDQLNNIFTSIYWAQPGETSEDVFDYIILGSKRGTLHVWDVKRGKAAFVLGDRGEGHTSRVNDICFNGKNLFTCSAKSEVISWSLETGKLKEKFFAAKNGLRRLSVSSTGLLAGGFYEIKVWDLSSKKVMKKLTGHASPISTLHFSPEAKFLISSSNDRFISIWSASLDDNVNPIRTIMSDNTPIYIDVRTFTPSTNSNERLDIAVTCRSGIVNLWNINTTDRTEKPQGADGSCACPASPLFFAQFFSNSQVLLVTNPTLPTFSLTTFRNADNSIQKQIVVNQGPAKSLEQKKGEASTKPQLLTPTKQTVAHPPAKEGPFPLEKALTSPAYIFPKLDKKKKKKETPSLPKDSEAPTDELSQEETKEAALPSLGELLSTSPAKSKEEDIVPKADSLKISLEMALSTSDESTIEKIIQTTKIEVIRPTVANLSPQHLPPLLRRLVQNVLSRPSERAFPSVQWLQVIFILHASYLMTDESVLPILVCLNQDLTSRLPNLNKLNALCGKIDMAMSLTRRGLNQGRQVAQTTYSENNRSAPFVGLRDDLLLDDVNEEEFQEKEEFSEEEKSDDEADEMDQS